MNEVMLIDMDEPADDVPNTPAVSEDRLRAKEETLRVEIRWNRGLLMRSIQIGVTVLAGLLMALYYVRRDIKESLVEMSQKKFLTEYFKAHPDVPVDQAAAQAKALAPVPHIGVKRWLIGTSMLALVSSIFAFITRHLAKLQRHYRQQLEEMSLSYTGIKEAPPGHGIRRMWLLFYAIPLFDASLWCITHLKDIAINLF